VGELIFENPLKSLSEVTPPIYNCVPSIAKVVI
jgi:hypothetical protein